MISCGCLCQPQNFAGKPTSSLKEIPRTGPSREILFLMLPSEPSSLAPLCQVTGNSPFCATLPWCGEGRGEVSVARASTKDLAERPTSPSHSLTRAGPSLCPLKGGEGLQKGAGVISRRNRGFTA